MSITHLNIQQSQTVYERIAPRDLESIYNVYASGNLDRQSVIKGAIDVSYGYKSHRDELISKFRQFSINIGEYYTEWDDKEFQRLISLLHGDGYGITTVDINKNVTLSTTAPNGGVSRPFFGNTEIAVIDMRPFKAFKYTRVEGASSNLCVVSAADAVESYNLKEIYYTSATAGSGFTPFSFIQNGDNSAPTYTLDKVWYEGVESKSTLPGQIYGHASNYNRCCIEHFYWLNHAEGIGYNNRKEYTRTDGTTGYYVIAGASEWNSRGSYMKNIIIDSPIPVLIDSHGWGNGKWGSVTKVWVPDDQLDDYNYIYQNFGDRPGQGFSTMTNYNAEFRSMKDWWVYPGKTTYQVIY